MKAVSLTVAMCLVVTGYIHADLYLNGYRTLPVIGPGFLLLASASFAVAALLLVGLAFAEPVTVRVAAAGLAGGALVAFALSRTVGLFGFLERGLQPSPQSLVSLLAEAAIVVLVLGTEGRRLRRVQRPSQEMPVEHRHR